MNPFVVGTYISKEYFCDRRVETESLEEHVRNGRNVVLFSERRMPPESDAPKPQCGYSA